MFHFFSSTEIPQSVFFLVLRIQHSNITTKQVKEGLLESRLMRIDHQKDKGLRRFGMGHQKHMGHIKDPFRRKSWLMKVSENWKPREANALHRALSASDDEL